MAHKVKKVIPSHLLEIRTYLKLTQKEMAEYLGVSARMIQKYEAEETTLPIDKAIYISKKWNYSLDQIYFDLDETKNPYNKFSEDIRNFLYREDDNIVLSLPDYYWEYLKESNNIMQSDILSSEKKRSIAELNGNYKPDPNIVFWKYTTPVNNFSKYIPFDGEDIPYSSADEDIKK